MAVFCCWCKYPKLKYIFFFPSSLINVQPGILDGVHHGTNVIIQTVIMKGNKPPPSYGLPRRGTGVVANSTNSRNKALKYTNEFGNRYHVNFPNACFGTVRYPRRSCNRIKIVF